MEGDNKDLERENSIKSTLFLDTLALDLLYHKLHDRSLIEHIYFIVSDAANDLKENEFDLDILSRLTTKDKNKRDKKEKRKCKGRRGRRCKRPRGSRGRRRKPKCICRKRKARRTSE